MSIFTWSDSFLLRIQDIDDHHKHLVSLLNLTYDSFISNSTDHEIDSLVEDLIQYASYHFQAEVSSMIENNYPFIEEHKLEHDCFSKRAQEFKALLHSGETAIELEILQFLKDWLADHILNSDKKFGYFVSAKEEMMSQDHL